jgi:hypothetical protein
MCSGINTEFALGAKGENGIGKLAEASPPAPDFTAESSRNQFSQKLGKKFDFREGRGGGMLKGRWLYAQNYLLDFGPVGAKDDHSQTPFEWVGSAECDRVALKALSWRLIPN